MKIHSADQFQNVLDATYKAPFEKRFNTQLAGSRYNSYGYKVRTYYNWIL